MEKDATETLRVVQGALVDALGLDASPSLLLPDMPLAEHPIAMDSLGFHRVIVELEIKRGRQFSEEALEAALFELVGDLVAFLDEQGER